MLSMNERANKVIGPVAARATSLGITRGEGCFIWDENNRKYIDFASGVAVCNTGHNHPEVMEAAKKQIDELIHGGHNVVLYESYVKLAEKLIEAMGGNRMLYYSNSGAEANEGAIKLAKYVNKRPAIISFMGAFHGRTLGALSVTTSKSKFRENYEGLLPSVYFAEYPNCFRCPFKQEKDKCDMECLKQFDRIFDHQVLPESVAVIIMEPVAGEGGYIVPPKEFVKGLAELCKKNGIFLIFDEIQTGFGRTGKLFAYQHFEVEPDIISCGKAIAGGFPLSATIARKEIMEKWPAGAHGGTFGGNPVSCAAALKVLELLQGGLLDNCQKMGDYFKNRLLKLKEKYSVIGDVRGLGLMIGAEFIQPETKAPNPDIVMKVRKYCLDRGLILLACGSHYETIRFIAPLIVTKDIIDEAISIFEAALKANI